MDAGGRRCSAARCWRRPTSPAVALLAALCWIAALLRVPPPRAVGRALHVDPDRRRAAVPADPGGRLRARLVRRHRPVPHEHGLQARLQRVAAAGDRGRAGDRVVVGLAAPPRADRAAGVGDPAAGAARARRPSTRWRGPTRARAASPPRRTSTGCAGCRSPRPGDPGAIEWLRDHAPHGSVVLEAVGDDYSAFGHARISTFTGLPTVMGWPGHELQWAHDPGRRRPGRRADLPGHDRGGAAAARQVRRPLRRRRAARAHDLRRRGRREVGHARPPRVRPRRHDGLGAAVIVLGDPPEAWEALGFARARTAIVALGEERLQLTGRGGGHPRGHRPRAHRRRPRRPAAQRTGPSAEPQPPPTPTAPSRSTTSSSSPARSTARSPRCRHAGLDLRRRDERMAFLRLGSYILEVVERGGDPARFWGLVVVVDDPGAVPGAGPAKNAVQPGRRIATVKGLGTALAVMSRRV